MAQKVLIELIDDLDGSEASQTLTFSLDGATYEVDLNDVNAEALRSSLVPFADKARRTGGRKQSSSETRAAGPAVKDIRAWAMAQGLEVNPRGRVPKTIIQQYLSAS